MTDANPPLAGPARALPSAGLSGGLFPPGDKSISHRAVMFAARAVGASEIRGLLEGDDVLRTVAAMRALGATVERTGPGRWTVGGVGRAFATPDQPLDFGNSGTGCRLALGLVAGAGVGATFTGDASLSARPMGRILEPLAAMGVEAESRDGRLPVVLKAGARPRPIDWESRIASAQVKSAVLLAGLGADGRTSVTEPHLSRDHTERLLAAFGVPTRTAVAADGAARVSVEGTATLHGTSIEVAADPSSAAFLAAAALVVPDSEVVLEGVMANPTRDGFFRTLAAMGVNAACADAAARCGEATARWTIGASALSAIAPAPEDAASMIDEYPILAVLAAYAEGESRFEGVAELRVKESDRIAATVAMLQANGVDAEELPDGFVVRGRGPGSVRGGGRVETRHDHRIAMSALILGLGAREPVEIDDASMIATSYPTFFDDLAALGARVETASRA